MKMKKFKKLVKQAKWAKNDRGEYRTQVEGSLLCPLSYVCYIKTGKKYGDWAWLIAAGEIDINDDEDKGLYWVSIPNAADMVEENTTKEAKQTKAMRKYLGFKDN